MAKSLLRLGTTHPRWTAASINFLTQDEMRRLLDVIPSKRDYAIFLLAYRHGLRASEVGMLRVADLDLKQYRLRIHRLKNSLAGLHPLQPDELKAVKAYLKERDSTAPALFLSRIRWAVTPHVLRHTFIVIAVQKGISLPALQRLLGHDRLTTTEIYLNLSPEEVVREFREKW